MYTTPFVWRLAMVVLLGAAYTSSFGADEWYLIEREDRPVTISASGVVVSAEQINFGAPATRSWQSTISQIMGEGQHAKKGDVLISFEGSSHDDRSRNLKGDLAVKKGELTSLLEQHTQMVESEKLALAQARSVSEKANLKAEQPKDLIPGVEYEILVEQRDVAERLLTYAIKRNELSATARVADRKALEAQISRLQKRVDGTEKDLSRLTIRAPRDGVVVVGVDNDNQKYDVGSSSRPGGVVISLVDETKLAIDAEVPENLASFIEIEQPVKVIVDSAGGIELKSKIIQVGSTVRRKSQNSQAMIREFRVELLADPQSSIKLGTSVQILVEIGIEPDAIAVPEKALVYRADTPGVMANSGWREVILGDRSEGMFIVVAGLQEGDEVKL